MEGEAGGRGEHPVVQNCGFLTTVQSSFGELPQRDGRYLVLTAHLSALLYGISCPIQQTYLHTGKHQENSAVHL